MKKRYRIVEDGSREVAVLVSRGFGAGWSTWGLPVEAIFDPVLVDFVEANRNNTIEFEEYMEKEYGMVYIGGADGLYVGWVPEGNQFIIEEYDGAESLCLNKNFNWLTA